MSSFDHLRTFIDKKQRENNLPRKDIAEAAGISTSTLSAILKKQPQLSVQSLLGIANYFNCSIDEVLGRKDFAPNDDVKFKEVELSGIMDSLKEFIKIKLEDTQQNIHKLSENCGLNQTTLNKFMKGDSSKVSISGAAAVSLADYFKVSLDEMIGRKLVTEKNITLGSERPAPPIKIPQLLEGFNAEDFLAIEDIRMKSNSQANYRSKAKESKPVTIKENQSIPQSKKPVPTR